MKDEHITLFVPYLQCAKLFDFYLLSLQSGMLDCFKDSHSITSFKFLIKLILYLSFLFNAVADFSIQSLLYFISYFDDFAVFEDILW